MKKQNALIVKKEVHVLMDMVTMCRQNPNFNEYPNMQTVFSLLRTKINKPSYVRIPFFDVQLYQLRQECFGAIFQQIKSINLISDDKARSIAMTLANNDLSVNLMRFFKTVVDMDLQVEMDYGYCDDDWEGASVIYIIDDVLTSMEGIELREIFGHIVCVSEDYFSEWMKFGMTVADMKDGYGAYSINPSQVIIQKLIKPTTVDGQKVDVCYSVDLYADKGAWLFEKRYNMSDFFDEDGKPALSSNVEDRMMIDIISRVIDYDMHIRRDFSANILVQYGNMIELADRIVEFYRGRLIEMGYDRMQSRMDLKRALCHTLEKKFEEILTRMENAQSHIFVQNMDA